MRGVIYSLRTLGFSATLKEALRRAGVIPVYTINGIKVSSDSEFRVLRSLKENGLLRYLKEDEHGYELDTGLLKIRAPNIVLLASITSIINDYSVLNVKNRNVIDVGAGIGDSTIFFVKQGANHVYAYEPIFYDILVKNIELNGIEEKVTAYPVAVGCSFGKLYINEKFADSGLFYGEKRVDCIGWKKVLGHQAYSVKIDCEGCEHSLLCIPCQMLSKHEEYLIEIHGPNSLIINHFLNCGYNMLILKSNYQYTTLVYFHRDNKQHF